ncbi:MAG: putative TIM-barrel fold metal-dependent hydrolase [Cellvibrionaceae bacterium]|jgi:predicted TIM-barrel fold metal-dependent hydrolase
MNVVKEEEVPIRQTESARRYRIIDSDVHHTVADWSDLQPYLNQPWRSRIMEAGSRVGGLGYLSPAGHRRKDAYPENGAAPGSDPELLLRQLCDDNKVDIAILTGEIYGWNTHPHHEYANAVIAAFNDFTIEHWLEPYSQLRGAIAVNSNDPQAAAAEIDRLGDRDDMVMVIMGATSTSPYGQKFYYPIYEAAVRHDLPVAIHPAAAGTGIAHPVTAVGYPRTFFEYHTALPTIFQVQLISIIAEGVFEKFPTLKWVFIEGGVAWLPQLMWRMDKNYKSLRADAPWVRQLPSTYIKNHCYFTTQPIEEPSNPDWLRQIFDMIDAQDMLLYASDYPHWDFDAMHVINRLPRDYRRKIFHENAEALFKL